MVSLHTATVLISFFANLACAFIIPVPISRSRHSVLSRLQGRFDCTSLGTRIIGPREVCITQLFPVDREIQASKRSSSRWRTRIPTEVTDRLTNNETPLPFKVKIEQTDDLSRRSTLLVRQINENDVKYAMRLCVVEYGSYVTSLQSSGSNRLISFFEKQWMYYENFGFSIFVSLGLIQRVLRRKISEESIQINGKPSVPSDHNVLCICHISDNGEEEIVGMAEISLQPPDPYRTSGPFVLPLKIKEIISKISDVASPMPYISNVLIDPNFRGLGYSKILMAACEGIAKEWGYNSIYLHVDADTSSGAAAQGLYRSLGYESVIDGKNDKKFNWIGPESIQKGLYIVEGVPLLFLKKDIS